MQRQFMQKQYKAKQQKELAMSPSTKQQIQLFRLMLMPTVRYRNQYLNLDMMKIGKAFQILVAKKDTGHLFNQARQLTRGSLCKLNLKLSVKFIKKGLFRATLWK